MNYVTSNITTTTHHILKEIVEKRPINQCVEVENIHIEKEVVNTQRIIQEQLNYVYNAHTRTIYQPVNNLGTIINITA